MSSSTSEAVKVIVRCRPMNSREMALKCKPVVQMNTDKCTCSLLHPGDYSAPPKVFTFDGVYNESSTTEHIYNEIAYPLIESVLDGYNSTIFAYGQTGCGKSFSMQGVQEPENQRGIIPRAFEHIFEAISLADNYKYLVLASYLEIYNEEIRDLLGLNTKKRLDLKESPDSGVYVSDLSYHAVHNVHECQKLMEQGWRNRAVGATLMNTDSSRSHSIFTISVEMMPVSQSLVDYCSPIRRGKLNLVDLAGSERQAKTGATGDRLKEATKINLSLSALGNVISALVDGKSKHIPYRDSKLTRLLQDSLGGNTKTLMVACLSPADNNYDETLSTLRYANRAKNICNKPHINEDPKDTKLREYQDEIQKLRQLLEQNSNFPTAQNIKDIIGVPDSNKNLEFEKEVEKLKKQYEEEYLSKCQVQADLHSLKMRYEEEISKLNEINAQKNAANANNNEPVDQIISNDQPKTNTAQLEILKRLEKLQNSMVGGERANDRELKEKRLKKKRAAEQRLNTLAKVLAKVEDEEGPLVLKVYDDIQDELRAKTELLRKYKQKVKALDREIQDLQSEFENERTDYLETIRKQERQLLLYNQILDNLLPALSKECNYRNIDKIKEDAKWCEESQSWDLPTLINPRIKFPPAAGVFNSSTDVESFNGYSWNYFSDSSSGRSSSTTSSPDFNIHRKYSLDQRFQKYDLENFAGNYFKPRRATELLLQAREDATKSINRWKGRVGNYQLIHS
ncbi:osmotic avoidance abnormal protein 3 isoform X2 [Planococcus citri]|uniref:osmotic avoidance abnormal protein 3 isoform X2 n=1 Tax=Planococcus citri TaxID=170843 RepID=UPI0031F89334